MASFPMKCLICDKSCASKKEWNDHLLEPVHSEKNKQESRQWGRKVRKCSLVVSGEFPLPRREILDYFGDGDNFVMNFLCDETCPLSGILYFENQNAIKKVLKETGMEVMIGDDKLQLQSASDMLQKERKAVLPVSDSSSSIGNVTGMAENKDSMPVAEGVEGKVCLKLETDKAIPTLKHQYSALCLDIRIPHPKFQQVNNLLGRMRGALKKHDPRAKLTLFRHWYLKLRNSGPDQPLIHLSMSNYRSLNMSCNAIAELFSSVSIIPNGTGLQEAGYPFIDEESGLEFELVTSHHYDVEVATCNWTQYLLKFDPRAKSLLSLVHFWAIENCLALEDKGKLTKQQQFEEDVQDSAALEWMCLFFLEKKKIIPSTMEVVDHPTYGTLPEPAGKHLFIPFPPRKDDMIQEWKDTHGTGLAEEGTLEYFLEVFRLAQGFFQFYSRSGKEESVKKEWERKICLLQCFIPRRGFSVCLRWFKRVVEPLMKITAKKLDFFFYTKEWEHVELKSLFRADRLEVVVGALESEVDLDQMVAQVDLSTYKVFTQTKCACQVKNTSSVCRGKFLRCHFTSVLEAMLMSEKEEEAIKEVQEQLNEIFESAGLRDCRAILFRGGHFKFGADSNFIMLFLDHAGLYAIKKGNRKVVQLKAKFQKIISRMKSNVKYFDEHQDLLLAPLYEESIEIGREEEEEILSRFSDPQLGLEFSIAPPFYLPEVQASRLVQYLCTFDPRVRPLMAIILYWAKINHIRLEKGGPTRFGFAPDPALLEWLVLYFLWSNGIVPSPEDLYFKDRDDRKIWFDGFNIGFKVDPEHVRKWKSGYQDQGAEANILDVYRLAQKFFSFCCKLGEQAEKNPLVVDLKSFHSFQKDELDEVDVKTNLRALSAKTKIPILKLNVINSESWIREEFYCQKKALTFLHPLHVKYGFEFCSETFLESICPKMSVTEKQLSGFLMGYENLGKRKNKKIAKVEYDVSSLLLL